MARDYIEKRDAGYWVAGTRVSLDSVVYAFLRGAALSMLSCAGRLRKASLSPFLC